MSKSEATVLVVGGGPVGLLTALRLGQAGIDTLVIEAHDTVLPTTRAMVYMPVVIPVLTKLGLIDAVKREAYLNSAGISWRNIDGEVLAHLPMGSSDPDEFQGVLLLGQYKMTLLILEELKNYPSVEVRFGWRFGGVEDDTNLDHAKVLVHSRKLNEPDTLLKAKYVVGTDGANSAVRRALCITFDGFTYPGWKMIGTDVMYDFMEEEKFAPLNFVVHPDHWAVIGFSGEDASGKSGKAAGPLWRVAYVEHPDLPASPADYMQRAHERITLWMSKGSKAFKVLRAEPYINHQRVASMARKGRVVLAGDALHSNNPIGGLGLTSGILDAYCFGNALIRVIKKGEPDDLLTSCASSRRQAWLEVTNQLSQANLNRLRGTDKETVHARGEFFHKLNTDDMFPSTIRAGFAKMISETFE